MYCVIQARLTNEIRLSLSASAVDNVSYQKFRIYPRCNLGKLIPGWNWGSSSYSETTVVVHNANIYALVGTGCRNKKNVRVQCCSPSLLAITYCFDSNCNSSLEQLTVDLYYLSSSRTR